MVTLSSSCLPQIPPRLRRAKLDCLQGHFPLAIWGSLWCQLQDQPQMKCLTWPSSQMHLYDSLDFLNFMWPPNFLAPSLGPWNELGSQGILVIFVDLCISRWGSRLLCLLRAKWSRSKDTCYPPTLVDNFIYSKSLGGRIWSRTHHINGGCHEEFVF